MTIREFFDKWNGKGIDFDGFYDNQCMDLAEEYNREVVNAPRLSGNAADVWDVYPVNFYEKIQNTPTGVPSLGDIVIWNRRVGGGFGHIAIFSEGDANKFTSFDQNWPEGSNCHFQEHDYKNVFGWLHPKLTNTVAVDSKVFENLVRKSTTLDKVVEKLHITDSETIVLAEINKFLTYEDDIRDKDRKLAEALQKIAELQKQLEKIDKDHEQLSAQNQALVIKTDELQTLNETLSKEAQNRQRTIDEQGDTIDTLKKNLEALQKATVVPVSTGSIIDFIRKLFRRR